jgi:hypothetical protein
MRPECISALGLLRASIQPYPISSVFTAHILQCNACLLQDHAMTAWRVVAPIANCEVRSGIAEYELQDEMTWGSKTQLGLKKTSPGKSQLKV